MAKSERLTIDANVALDYLRPKRAGHDHAVALFELARRGEVELATAPQGYRLDARQGDLARQLQAAFASEGVGQARQVARVSEVTFPGEDLFPGHYDERFAEAWDQIAGGWPSHERKPPRLADRFHVETHLLDKRDAFLTADKPLLTMIRRLNEEHGFAIVAMTVAEYLDRRD
jgi:hypothetical protein